MKKFLMIFLSLAVLFTSVYAEDKKDDDLMTVEEAYLNTIEAVVINEMLSTDGRDAKFLALQYIEKAIDEGRDSENIQKALAKLATIGLSTTVREGGRIINNFPDVRIKACELLGKTGNDAAKAALRDVMYLDNEPSVVTAAVRALTTIGFNEGDDEILQVVNWVNSKFDAVNPTSSLAYEILNTYEKIAPNVKDKTGLVEGVMRIAGNYKYVTPVRSRAKEVLNNISGLGNSKN